MRKHIWSKMYNINRLNSNYPINTSSISKLFNQYHRHFCASSESLESKIRQKLESELEPTELNVYDTSGGCGSFFGIEIKSHHFNGKKTFQQHKLVNKVLKEEIEILHGLSLKTHPTDTENA